MRNYVQTGLTGKCSEKPHTYKFNGKVLGETGLGFAFFSVLNALFFCVLLKNAMYFTFLVTYETQKIDAFFS